MLTVLEAGKFDHKHINQWLQELCNGWVCAEEEGGGGGLQWRTADCSVYKKNAILRSSVFCNHPAISLSRRILKYLFKLIWHTAALLLYTRTKKNGHIFPCLIADTQKHIESGWNFLPPSQDLWKAPTGTDNAGSIETGYKTRLCTLAS